MKFLNFFNTPSFIISLAIGIFFVYIGSPQNQIIYVYPKPDNLNKILYKDKANTCFQFTSKNVPCPPKESAITKYPIQESLIINNQNQ